MGGWPLRRHKSCAVEIHAEVRLMFGRGVEGDVDDGFELDWDSLFGGGAELPLTESVHGVGVELVVNAADELDTVDGAVTANHGVEDDFPFDMLIDQCGRILRVDLSQWAGSGNFGGR